MSQTPIEPSSNPPERLSDAEIGKAILEGVDKDGEDLCAFMIPQPDMSEGDLADLIEYLRGMPANDRKITSACPL